MPAPVLTDGVVVLRAHRAEDVARVVEQCLDPVSQKPGPRCPWGIPGDGRGVRRQTMPGGWADGSEWGFAVEVEGRFGGTVSLRDEGSGLAEIAFGVAPRVRGTGAMERALRLLRGLGVRGAAS